MKDIDSQTGQYASNRRFAYLAPLRVFLHTAGAHDFKKVLESLDSDNAEEVGTRQGKMGA